MLTTVVGWRFAYDFFQFADDSWLLNRILKSYMDCNRFCNAQSDISNCCKFFIQNHYNYIIKSILNLNLILIFI